MARAEAPKTLHDRPSSAFLFQTLREQTRKSGQVVDSTDPHRLLQQRRRNQAFQEMFQGPGSFQAALDIYQPTPEDLVGK